MLRGFALTVAVAVVAACGSSESPTTLVVEVFTEDLAAGVDFDEIVVAAFSTADGRPLLEAPHAIGAGPGQFSVPLQVGLSASSPSNATIAVRAVANRAKVAIVSQEAVVAFQSHRQLTLKLVLSRVCQAVTCTSADLTCLRGDCLPKRSFTTTPFRGPGTPVGPDAGPALPDALAAADVLPSEDAPPAPDAPEVFSDAGTDAAGPDGPAPVRDASPEAGRDTAQDAPRDTAPAVCGALNQACCTGALCGMGLTCTMGVCRCVPGALACSGVCRPGFVCCPGTTGGSCGNCGTDRCNTSGQWECSGEHGNCNSPGAVLCRGGDPGCPCPVGTRRECDQSCNISGCF